VFHLDPDFREVFGKIPEEQRAVLSHYIRTKFRKKNEPFVLQLPEIQEAIKKPLPSVEEQYRNLIRLIVEETKYPGREINRLELQFATAAIGSVDIGGPRMALNDMQENGLISVIFPDTAQDFCSHLSLTYQGWLYWDRIQRTTTNPYGAFMAYQFRSDQSAEEYDDLLYEMINTDLHITLGSIGFDLKDITINQSAGSIDDRLRNTIRSSRFLLAEVSHGNQNVFWEAGFAEGYGIPVIYLCHKSRFANKSSMPFDTNHLLCVQWTESTIDHAMIELANVIGATFPGEVDLSKLQVKK